MNEPNATPPGKLAEYLVGDLGPARRHIRRLINGEQKVSQQVLVEIWESIDRCVQRLERDAKQPAQQQIDEARARFIKVNGFLLRRATAMKLLGIHDGATFRKVVDATPRLKHRLPGEVQPRYVTAVVFDLLPTSAWCATCGEESKPDSSLWKTRTPT